MEIALAMNTINSGNRLRAALLASLLIVISITNCTTQSTTILYDCPTNNYSSSDRECLTRDYWPTDNWRNSAPEEQGMNSTLLNGISEFIQSNYSGLDSILVIRHGYIVLEEYPSEDFDNETEHSIASCRKSVTGALIGLAIDQGFLDNVSQKVLDFFPDYTFDNMDDWKRNITIEHLLTMTGGFDWNESDPPYGNPLNQVHVMQSSEDPIKYMLDIPMRSAPGTEWEYCSGGTYLLRAILWNVTGMSPFNFASEYLFNPIGALASWRSNLPESEYSLRSTMLMTPRDMARFGYLYLNGGMWDGEQIVSGWWVLSSTETQISLNDKWSDVGYGYLWWTTPSTEEAYALGYSGQLIYILPQQDLVVVFTSPFTDHVSYQNWLMDTFILPSILESSLPTNPPINLVPLLAIAIIVPVLIAIAFMDIKRSATN
ncbi:MAG: serine hydrolase domain-containing protein [Candidatus Thorarchaeota archaeon]